jgi:hypothetical protein
MRNQTVAIERHPLPFVFTRMVGDLMQSAHCAFRHRLWGNATIHK